MAYKCLLVTTPTKAKIFDAEKPQVTLSLNLRERGEPLVKLTALNKSINIPLVTPMIGELVNLKDEKQQFKQWWLDVK